jgi:hypothetical protein
VETSGAARRRDKWLFDGISCVLVGASGFSYLHAGDDIPFGVAQLAVSIGGLVSGFLPDRARAFRWLMAPVVVACGIAELREGHWIRGTMMFAVVLIAIAAPRFLKTSAHPTTDPEAARSGASAET